jgi:hypothetical protein
MNWDRLLALHHVCTQWHGGQWSELYRLGCVVAKHMTVRGADEYAITLDLPDNEEARRLYGVYAIALGGCKEGSTYMACACDGCQDDYIIGEEWERGIRRCASCHEHGCDHRGCVCPEAEEEAS